jgi:polar amino acid transport system substrate-binding protein
MCKALSTSVLLLCALPWMPTADARSLQQVLNQGSLRVGVALAAPWTVRGESGELTGFEIDVANKLAEDMQVRPELLVYAFADLIAALEAGEIDVIAAGLTITPERALHVNFSQAYASAGISLATNLTRTATVTRFEELDAESYKIAAVENSVAAELVQRLLPQAELVLFASIETASEALLAGAVDAYLEDEPVPTFLALEHDDTIDLPIARPLLRTHAGFAVNKGDPDFLAFLNAWITSREADTWLPTTYRYWFKSLAWRDRR